MFLQLDPNPSSVFEFSFFFFFFFKENLNLYVIPYISLNNSYNTVQLVKKIKHISTSLRHRLDKQDKKRIRRKTGHKHGDEDLMNHMRRRGLCQPRNIH